MKQNDNRKCTESQSDGYLQIMRICDAMREEHRYCLGYVSKREIKSPHKSPHKSPQFD